MERAKIYAIAVLIGVLSCSWKAPDCRKLKLEYAVDIKTHLSQFDKSRDSLLESNSEIELHFREDINGYCRILINDSLYFEGELKGNSRIGYDTRIFNIPIRDGNNYLTLVGLGAETHRVTIKINSNYKYLIIEMKKECTILAKSSNKRPFRG